MELTYTKHGDYYLPDLDIPAQEKVSVNRYGQMHGNYLKKNNRTAYNELDDPDFVPKPALTSSEEYASELQMDYMQLVQHLLQKYGKAKGDYFLTETCATKNKKITRTSEGLFCHHIDEDKAILLSEEGGAIKNPFEYQKAERLVYCNILEHLLLHIKIVEAPRNEMTNKGEFPGIGGAIDYLIRQINDFYDGYDFSQHYLDVIMSYIKDNFEDYIKILNHFWGVIRSDLNLSIAISKERLAYGWAGNVVQKVYNRIQ